jgi:hypothetical protein
VRFIPKLLAIPIWLASVLAFITCLGRFTDFFATLYEGADFTEGFFSMAARAIPVDFVAIGLGISLIISLVIQVVKFKKEMVGVLIISAKMAGVALCFFMLLDYLGWATHQGQLASLSYILIPTLIVLMFVGIIGLSFLFYHGMRSRVTLPNGLFSYPLYSALVWANVATILASIQVVLILCISFYR